MRIYRRNLIIYNTVLYVILSFVYLHVCFSLDADISALDFDRFIGLVTGLPILLVIAIITILSVLLVNTSSTVVLSVFSLFIFYKTFSIFLITYDKFQLVLNFIYLITSFNIIILMRDELSKALYSQNYTEGALDVGAYSKMRIFVDHNGKRFEGAITNFDEEGFVVKPFDKINGIKGKVNFSVTFEGNTFDGDGEVVTHFKESMGIKVLKRADSSSKLGWEELYSIIFKRNYFI